MGMELRELRNLAADGCARRRSLAELRPGMVVGAAGDRAEAGDVRFNAGQVVKISPTTDGHGRRVRMRWLFGAKSTGNLLVWPDEAGWFWEYYRAD